MHDNFFSTHCLSPFFLLLFFPVVVERLVAPSACVPRLGGRATVLHVAWEEGERVNEGRRSGRDSVLQCCRYFTGIFVRGAYPAQGSARTLHRQLHFKIAIPRNFLFQFYMITSFVSRWKSAQLQMICDFYHCLNDIVLKSKPFDSEFIPYEMNGKNTLQ